MQTSPCARRAFTLIELLIVVAIIAILAAIAVPNFLEAQTRSKISRVQADMRAVATALEAYAVDYNAYPPNVYDDLHRTNVMTMSMGKMPFVPYTLSTPIAYITSVPLDTFKPLIMHDHQHSFVYYNSTNTPDGANRRTYRAIMEGHSMMQAGRVPEPQWAMVSTGPDYKIGTMAHEIAVDGALPIFQIMTMAMPTMGVPITYDPTNGTVSDGDVARFGP
ncbi:MAG: ral secretion pathway protein [Candidatus Sumerlaeota bacterium]|nr:ral secretion pathway protein [Candidatus Sumerlaeota bacterium]